VSGLLRRLHVVPRHFLAAPFAALTALAALATLTAALAAGTAFGQDQLDIQGHRGARALAPENTLPAFRKALQLGVNTIECDLGITTDGVVVIHHDLRLNPDTTRGPDGAWLDGPGPLISALTFDELQRYDVGRLKPGTDYARAFPQQQPADGTRIPRLADLFDLVKGAGNESVGFDCETKLSPLEPAATLAPEAFAQRVIAAVRDAGMQRRMTIQSFAEAHALGLAVIPWTVNEPAMIARLIDMGVDGIISDRPDLVQEAWARRKPR
jgi:glycerophosphoryl diester phosphodiesterase